MSFPRISKLKTAADFSARLNELKISLPFDDVIMTGKNSPLGNSMHYQDGIVGNRFCILPMEGWDGTKDGKPTELTRRRWKNFGLSGAKMIWGGEAIAIRHDGRANPNQLLINEKTVGDLKSLRGDLVDAHNSSFGTTDDLLVGLQLTHSGRFAKPNSSDRLEPRTVYRHPLLDERLGIDSSQAILSDDDLKQLIDDFIKAAVWAEVSGFDFVDIKHCHGYLGHEILTGYDRPGEFGGSFENRTRFLVEIVSGIQSCTKLKIGTRVSVFDFVPFVGDADNVGLPQQDSDYRFGFGGDGSGNGIDLTEPHRFMQLLQRIGIQFVCTTAGSPYYNPHIQRPALFPPSDGYQPPEDPLMGVARQINVTADLKKKNPELIFVGSAYSYLQEWLPYVGQRLLTDGKADFIGLGRIALSYPTMPKDVLSGMPLERKKICRTFSDCTTGPRNGLISGCFPLDPFYKQRPEYDVLKNFKSRERRR